MAAACDWMAKGKADAKPFESSGRGSIATEISLPRGIDVEVFALGGEHRNHLGKVFKVVLVADLRRGSAVLLSDVSPLSFLQIGAQLAFMAQF